MRCADGHDLGLCRPLTDPHRCRRAMRNRRGKPLARRGGAMIDASKRFRVALTADFFAPDGPTKFPDIGLSVFDGRDHLEWSGLGGYRTPIGPDQLSGVQGAIVLTPAVTAESVARSHDLLAISRFGVGYDAVDVAACTLADVV